MPMRGRVEVGEGRVEPGTLGRAWTLPTKLMGPEKSDAALCVLGIAETPAASRVKSNRGTTKRISRFFTVCLLRKRLLRVQKRPMLRSVRQSDAGLTQPACVPPFAHTFGLGGQMDAGGGGTKCGCIIVSSVMEQEIEVAFHL
jgi:hypothetical protein